MLFMVFLQERLQRTVVGFGNRWQNWWDILLPETERSRGKGFCCNSRSFLTNQGGYVGSIHDVRTVLGWQTMERNGETILVSSMTGAEFSLTYTQEHMCCKVSTFTAAWQCTAAGL
jgi:hypothetical protein